MIKVVILNKILSDTKAVGYDKIAYVNTKGEIRNNLWVMADEKGQSKEQNDKKGELIHGHKHIACMPFVSVVLLLALDNNGYNIVSKEGHRYIQQ